MSIERKKVCSQCQTEFSCFTENCWCAELPQIMPLSEGGDCLCPDCLKVTIDKKFEEQKENSK
jgi:hypothetical protein